MTITFQRQGKSYSADLSKPLSLAIPLRDGAENPNCFWAPMPEFSPVIAGDFIGSTAKGGPVNFFNVRFNPHGNGTHTECVGHISTEPYKLNECLLRQHFFAKVISIYPIKQDDGDRIITKEKIAEFCTANECEALIIRTLPNDDLKKRTNWSGSNPPYIHYEALQYLAEIAVEHLLLDLPSVDREEDGGKLLAHRAFWQYPENTRHNSTITEMIYVPNEIKDGYYLLNLQTTALDLDATPSKPLLFRFL